MSGGSNREWDSQTYWGSVDSDADATLELEQELPFFSGSTSQLSPMVTLDLGQDRNNKLGVKCCFSASRGTSCGGSDVWLGWFRADPGYTGGALDVSWLAWELLCVPPEEQ